MSLWNGEEANASAVDVVVLARDGSGAAQRCLASLYAATCRAMREIIVIDDASSGSELTDWLNGEAGASRITLLRNNDEGRGVAASINRAFALHPERDVVLLEGSVEVANDWLDRLLACAQSQADIGTVTPFSNNALFCAYPFAGWEGGLPGAGGLAALDMLASSVNAGQWVELPAAEKFCMLIRRACLDMIGFFDVERFGHGSGEAKDFSRRAAAVGWRNVLAANVFVYRAADAVPDPGRVEAIEDAEYRLSALYPDYGAKVQDFVHLDPAARLRARIDRARAAQGGSGFASVMEEQARKRALRTASQADAPLDPPLPTVLHITHDKAGSGRWVRDYCAADLNCRNLVLRGRSSRNAATAELALFDPRQGALPLMTWTLAEPIKSVAIEHAEVAGIVKWVCDAFRVRALLVSSLVGGSLDLLRLGLPTVLTVHDLFPFCPALSGFFGRPCEGCDDRALERCLRENPHNAFWHLTDAGDWHALRAAFTECLAAGNVRVVVPDEELHARWAALFPELGGQPWTRIAYGLGAAFTRGSAMLEREAVQADAPRPRLRVLVPGRLLPHTGLDLWRKIYDELRAFANVLLLDCGEFGQPFADCAGIEVACECDFHEWPEKITQWRPDCALLLSSQPESFCYALLEMQALAVPVVAVRVGTCSGRIDNGWNGFLVDSETDAILDILHALDQARERLATVGDILRFSPVRTAFDMVADYRKLLPELGKAGIEIENGVEAGLGRETEILLAILGKRLRAQEENLRLKDLLQVREEEAYSRMLNQRRLESMVGTLAAQHAAILHSASWKASVPVRYFGRLWKRMCQRVSPLPEKPQVVRSTRIERRKAPRPERPVPLLLRSRASARYWLCEVIGVPDASVIIAGGGPDQSQRALQNFVALADTVTRSSARACFVWCGRLDNLRSDDTLALELLREVGDLFVLDTQLDAEVFAGADVLLLPAETVGQAGFNGRVAGIAHVELPLDPPEAGAGAVMASTVTQLLHYCDNTDKTDTRQTSG